MDLQEEILKEHSKKQCDKIVRWVGKSQKRFDDLFHLFLTGQYRVIQRAAWPVSYCVIAHPGFIKHNFSKLIKNLHKEGLHNSVKRNTVRLLQHLEIPEKYQGEVLEICFNYISSPAEPVAVKAFSLTVLSNLAKLYPELLPELKLIIVEQLPHQTAAFKSRAKKILQ